ncbi:unnamed protein product [Lepidochelys kempii]
MHPLLALTGQQAALAGHPSYKIVSPKNMEAHLKYFACLHMSCLLLNSELGFSRHQQKERVLTLTIPIPSVCSTTIGNETTTDYTNGTQQIFSISFVIVGHQLPCWFVFVILTCLSPGEII